MLRSVFIGLSFFCCCGAWGSESLLQLFSLAVQNDPDYRGIRYGHEATLEQENQAFGSLLPSIGVEMGSFGNRYGSESPGADPAITPPVGTRFNEKQFGLTITQPLYRPELTRARGVAEWRSLQSKAELDFSLQDLIVRLAERYFGLLRSEDDLENARGELEAFGKQLELSKERLEFGLVAITDVDEAQAGYDLARARVIEAENDVRSARDALATITGKEHPLLARLRGDSPIEPPEPATVSPWTAFAMNQNLQLLAARYASNATEGEIQRASAGHLPSLDFLARRSREAANGGQSGPLTTNNMVLGMQLSIPIYQGGQVQSRTREARALHLQSLARLERERRAVLRETRESFFGISTSIARIDALKQAVRSAESAVESITQSYELNFRTSFEVLLAQRDLFRARRDLTGARYDYVVGLLRLKRAAGTLVEPDLAKINAWLGGSTNPNVGSGPAVRLAMPADLARRTASAIAPFMRPLFTESATTGIVLKPANEISAARGPRHEPPIALSENH